jgi:hypothetical protein
MRAFSAAIAALRVDLARLALKSPRRMVKSAITMVA